MSTSFADGAWSWRCPTCHRAAHGYQAEHHARTILDEHHRLHQYPDLAESRTLASPIDMLPRKRQPLTPIERQMILMEAS